MSKKTIRLTLTPDSIGAAIREYAAWRKDIESKTKEFVQALAEEGVEVARVGFSEAVYDGTNDVTCHVEKKDDLTSAVVATGNAVLFIEFGSGITYNNFHPEAEDLGMERGEYGYKLGRLPEWRYSGEPGTNGEVITTGPHAGQIKTRGNPANMAMYNAKADLEDRFAEIARRIFA